MFCIKICVSRINCISDFSTLATLGIFIFHMFNVTSVIFLHRMNNLHRALDYSRLLSWLALPSNYFTCVCCVVFRLYLNNCPEVRESQRKFALKSQGKSDFSQSRMLETLLILGMFVSNGSFFLPDRSTAEKPLLKNPPFKESTDHGLRFSVYTNSIIQLIHKYKYGNTSIISCHLYNIHVIIYNINIVMFY